MHPGDIIPGSTPRDVFGGANSPKLKPIPERTERENRATAAFIKRYGRFPQTEYDIEPFLDAPAETPVTTPAPKIGTYSGTTTTTTTTTTDTTLPWMRNMPKGYNPFTINPEVAKLSWDKVINDITAPLAQRQAAQNQLNRITKPADLKGLSTAEFILLAAAYEVGHRYSPHAATKEEILAWNEQEHIIVPGGSINWAKVNAFAKAIGDDRGGGSHVVPNPKDKPFWSEFWNGFTLPFKPLVDVGKCSVVGTLLGMGDKETCKNQPLSPFALPDWVFWVGGAVLVIIGLGATGYTIHEVRGAVDDARK